MWTIGMANSHIPVGWCLNTTGTFAYNNMTTYTLQYYCSKVELNLTSCTLLQSREEMEAIQHLCQASDIIWDGIFWFSTVSGIIGNCLAMLTIVSLPSSTATFYIGVLAFSDLLALIVRLIMHFMNEHRLLNPKEAYWQIFPLMFDFTASYSSWLLVLICLERLITIRYPFQKRYYFTMTVARMSTVFMAVFLFVVYNIATWNLGYTDMRMFTIRNLLYAVIPLFLILTLIILIAFSIRSIHKNRKCLQERSVYINTTAIAGTNFNSNSEDGTAQNIMMTSSALNSSETVPLGKKLQRYSGSGGGGGGGGGVGCSTSSSLFREIARMENSITIMMVVAAVCFALLTIPNCVHLVLYQQATRLWNTPVSRARWHVFSKTAHALPFLNLAINFLLYFLSTKKFRTHLCKVLRLHGRQTPESCLPLNTYSVNYSVSDNKSELCLNCE